MDFLECAKAVRDFLFNEKNTDFSACKSILKKYSLKEYDNSSDGYNLYKFTLELKSKLNMKPTLTEEEIHIDNLLPLYDKCITLLERKKKLEKLMK